MVERCYWERYHANNAIYPDPGGMLDQDEHLMADLGTYGWLAMLAGNNLDRDEEIQKQIAEARKRK